MQTAKRIKMTGPLIGTHNGHFHADEALAVYLLRLLPDYHGSGLLRSRDPELLKTCHTVVDVGGVYDDAQKRYDHHQREFDTSFPSHATKLSSAGLVYMHFGKAIISYCTGLSQDHPDVDLLYTKLYDDFVEAFDANDNGIAVFDATEVRKSGLQRKFQDKGFSIASVVNRFNYSHPTPTPSVGAESTPEQRQAQEDERFLKASHFVGEQFLSELMDKYHSWLPARATVKQAFSERTKYDEHGRIMIVPYKPGGVPWSDHLYALEKETGAEGNVLYVLFPENGEPDCKWRIRAVGIEAGGFENRKSLPDAWKGVRDDELSKVSGIPGCIFVHASGFIGGNKTFDGALEMAKQALAI
ncbi:hypothetical protein ANO11243_077430 [Dothideomycetidae sp. 11243]|nr:hypothetical protein ANO11243_077430 [fungal sp. No.11243]